MAFEEAFTTLMSEQGIDVDVATVPDPDTMQRALDNTNAWFWDLDAAVREGFDESSLEYAVCSLLADPDLNVAPELFGILAAFDQVAGRTLSQLLDVTRDCLTRATDGIG